MTEDILNELPEVLARHTCTLKAASYDDSRNVSMCESRMKVINFDKIPKAYLRGKGWRHVPNSNDALYISPDKKWFFIEFKNGSIDRSDVYRKIYDSIIMLIELGSIFGDWRRLKKSYLRSTILKNICLKRHIHIQFRYL